MLVRTLASDVGKCVFVIWPRVGGLHLNKTAVTMGSGGQFIHDSSGRLWDETVAPYIQLWRFKQCAPLEILFTDDKVFM